MANYLIVQKSEECIPNLLDFIKGKSERICIASMSRSYEFMKSKLAEKGVPAANLFFLDCISKSLFIGVKDTDDCRFIQMQWVISDFLYELKAKLKEAGSPKIFMFDSLSDLKKYWPGASEIVRFSKSLFPVMAEMGADSYFIIYEDDKDKCTDDAMSAFDGTYMSFDREMVFKR